MVGAGAMQLPSAHTSPRAATLALAQGWVMTTEGLPLRGSRASPAPSPRFTDEDFYIYSVAHSYKHYVAGGNGIRSLMDTYVFLHAVGDRMNMDYVRAELEKLGLVWYHEMIAKIADMLFDNSCKAPGEMIASMDEAMRDTVAFFIDSGTYGTRRHLIETKLQGEIKVPRVGFWKKVGYLFTRIFPRMEFYRLNFPVAYRHKILIPVFWFYRLFRGIFCKPAQILSEWKIVFKTK